MINHAAFIEPAEIIREKGTNRSRFFRGQVDKYTWVDLGSSYLPSDMLAAFLYVQLEARGQIQAKRRLLWETYHEHLQQWALAHAIQLPTVPEHCDQSHHTYYLLLPSLEDRQALISHLKQRGIQSVFHYLPLHLSEVGQRYGGRSGDLPVTERVSDCLLRLPFYNGLSEDNQMIVIEAILEFEPTSTFSTLMPAFVRQDASAA